VVFADLASKPTATVSSGLVSKPAVTVFSSFAAGFETKLKTGDDDFFRFVLITGGGFLG
jgi:hypothetical protein